MAAKTKRRFTNEEDKVVTSKKMNIAEKSEKIGRSITAINKRAAYLHKKQRASEAATVRLVFNGVAFEINSAECTIQITGTEINISTND